MRNLKKQRMIAAHRRTWHLVSRHMHEKNCSNDVDDAEKNFPEKKGCNLKVK